jgi:hypothetical protein
MGTMKERWDFKLKISNVIHVKIRVKWDPPDPKVHGVFYNY